MGMKFDEADCLDGERLLVSKAANLIVRPSDFGLSRFAADGLLWTVGMKNKEAIGGKLHLTSYRLLFKAHGVNRLVGQLSLFLPQINTVQDTSRLLVRRVSVKTALTQSDFIMWGIAKFLRRVAEARAALSQSDHDRLRGIAAAHLARQDSRLQVSAVAEGMNSLAKAGFTIEEFLSGAANPLQKITTLLLLEALDPAMEAWNDMIDDGGGRAGADPGTAE